MHSPSSASDTLLERAEDVANNIARPNAEAVDREARWPEEAIRALQEKGLGGLVVPAEAGGQGRGLRALAEVCEVLGKACSSTALCFGMHCVGTACLAAKATGFQRKNFLEPIAAGEHLTTLALSEPGTGSHFYLAETQLIDRGEHYVVEGTKSFVTNGGHADSYVVSSVAAGEKASPGEFSCIAVPADAEGLDWQAPWQGVGMRGNAARSVDLHNVAVPHEHLLGAEGEQIWYVFHVVAPSFLVAMSGTYLGIAAAALEEAREHLKARTYSFGGRSPAQTSVVQRELGILWRRVEEARRLIYHAASASDEGADDALVALCSAKAGVARCVVDVVNGAMTLVGGRGYGERSKLGRLLRDCRAADIMAPTTQLLEVWCGRALLDLPLLVE